MTVIGVDPGKTGAACLLAGGSLEFLDTGKLTPKLMLEGLRWWLSLYEIRGAVLEAVSSRPEQGVKSTFTFGTNYGWWQGVLDGLGVPWRLARPQEWQKGLVPPKAGKDGALVVAQRLFPEAEFHGPKGGLKDGRVDAALIAEYCRRINS